MAIPSPVLESDDFQQWTDKVNTLINHIDSGIFESGTVTVFPQAAAPTGWTQLITLNDRVLRLVDNTGVGGSSGGSWTLSGMSVSAHTLTEAELPTHTHQVYSGSADFDDNSWGLAASSTNGVAGVYNGTNAAYRVNGGDAVQTLQSEGGGGSHSHNFNPGTTWRPSYVDAIYCSRN